MCPEKIVQFKEVIRQQPLLTFNETGENCRRFLSKETNVALFPAANTVRLPSTMHGDREIGAWPSDTSFFSFNSLSFQTNVTREPSPRPTSKYGKWASPFGLVSDPKLYKSSDRTREGSGCVLHTEVKFPFVNVKISTVFLTQ